MEKLIITNENFEEVFPEIATNLITSNFVSIDAEFSGILSDSPLKYSLFDTPEDRYTLVRDNIKDFVIIQFGCTAYHYNQSDNKYTGSSCVFYVLDVHSTISVGIRDKKLTFEKDALDFLSGCGFNFDRLLNEGVGYLNKPEEKKLRDYLEKFRNSNHNLSVEMEMELQLQCTRVAKWLKSADNRNPLLLFNKIDYTKKLEVFLIARRIQKRFPTLGIYKDSNGQVHVEVYRRSYSGLTGKKSFVDEDEFIDECIGVTKLFRLLAQLKKPIVGHNLLLDLMFMYQQFYEPLPTEYKEFKKNINLLFPTIYDTKFLSYELRELLAWGKKWESNELSKLYKYFKEGRGFYLAPYAPFIKLDGSTVNALEENQFHEAGWDSFCTGYCFIKIMHFFAIKKMLDCKHLPKPVVFQQHLHAVKPYMNRINVAMAHVNQICFDGPDPASKRPNWLVVTSLYDPDIDPISLRVHFTNVHGVFDIRRVSKNTVHIAANSEFAMGEIMETLKEVKLWHTVPYKPNNSTLRCTLIRVLPWVAGLSLGALLIMYRLK